VIDWRVGVAG